MSKLKLVILLSLMVCSACSFFTDFRSQFEEKKVDSGKSITISAEEPSDWDWQKSQEPTTFLVAGNLMMGLMTYDLTAKEFPLIPGLAENSLSSVDFSEHRFKLKSDIFWSDRKAITVNDFIFSIKRMMTPGYSSPWSDWIFKIKNAERFFRSEVEFSEVGVKENPKGTLEIILEKADPLFPYFMAHPAMFPLRPEHLKFFGGQKRSPTFPTNGKFSLAKDSTHKNLILSHKLDDQKFKSDLRISLTLQKTEIGGRNFNQKEVDILLNEEGPIFFPTTQLTLLLFNPYIKPFINPIVRRVISMAVDRGEMAKHLSPEPVPVVSVVPPGHLAFESNRGVRFDSTFAKELLHKSGWSNIKDYEPLTLKVGSHPSLQKIAAEVKIQLKNSLDIDVKPVENNGSMVIEKKGDTHLSLAVWRSAVIESSAYIQLFEKNGLFGVGNWKDYDFLQYSKKAVISNGRDERIKYIAKAQHSLTEEEVIVLPLFVSTQGFLVQKKITGLKFNPLGFLDLETVQSH